MAEARTTERPGGLRDLGLRIGTLPTGPANAITDVGDVAVGHVTVVRDEPGRPAGRGVARTGVTAIAPRAPRTLLAAPAPAGAAVLNGAGEMTGFLQVSEWGVIETPVYLTSTMAVGRVFDGAVAAAAAADPAVRDQVVIPVVAECDDSWLNEPIPVQVEADDAGRALATATGGPVAQGAVGAGTGMICFGWKGGIGTSSRVVEDLGATVGVLVLANFGAWRDLRIDGVPVGRLLGAAGDGPAPVERTPAGSCIAVVATDAAPRDCPARAGRAVPASGSRAPGPSPTTGAARSSSRSPPEHATARLLPVRPTGRERRASASARCPTATSIRYSRRPSTRRRKAVLNALWAAEDTTGRGGRIVRALPHDDVVDLLTTHRRLGH